MMAAPSAGATGSVAHVDDGSAVSARATGSAPDAGAGAGRPLTQSERCLKDLVAGISYPDSALLAAFASMCDCDLATYHNHVSEAMFNRFVRLSAMRSVERNADNAPAGPGNAVSEAAPATCTTTAPEHSAPATGLAPSRNKAPCNECGALRSSCGAYVCS